MKKQLVLSGVALTVLILATAPASAQIVTFGGNGGSDATVNLDIGGDGGNLVDLNGGGDAEVNVDLNGSGGGNIIVLGDGTAVVDLNGNGIVDDDELDATVNLFGPGSNGSTRLTAGTGGNDDDVLVTLFGPAGSGDTATVNILPGGAGGIGGGGDEGADATIDLFGPGAGNGGGGGTDPTQTGNIGGSASSNDNGGDGTDPTQTGNIGGSASSNDNGGDGSQVFTAGGSAAGGANASVRVAATGAGAADDDCFTPDNMQIAHLLNRSSYGASVTASWQDAAKVSLVPVMLCPEAEARVAAALDAHAGIDAMYAAIAANAKIRAALGGRTPADVLAVDQSGDTLTVYVY